MCGRFAIYTEPVKVARFLPAISGSHGESPPSIGDGRAVDTYSIYGGIDHRGTIGKLAPGIFAQEDRCWRLVYENAAGHEGHCIEPVAWIGRWKFLKVGRRCGVASGTPTISLVPVG